MSDSTRMFFKSFSVSFLILSIISATLMLFLIKSGKDDSSDQQSQSQATYLPSKDEDLTVLLVICEKRGSAAENLAIIKVSPVNDTITLAQLPAQDLEVSTSTYRGNLIELYDYGGANAVITALSNEFSITINRYIRVDHSSLASVVDYLGGMSYTPSQQIEYTYDEDKVLTIKPVEQMIDGRRFVALSQQEDIGKLLNELITQRFNSSLDIEEFFQTLVNETDTNCTSLDYKLREKGWLQMFSMENYQLNYIPLDGSTDWTSKIKSSF